MDIEPYRKLHKPKILEAYKRKGIYGACEYYVLNGLHSYVAYKFLEEEGIDVKKQLDAVIKFYDIKEDE